MTQALVLGGGGVAGIAWETGLLMGLHDAGLDVVTPADRIVGTSAGSAVAAQVTSGTPIAELYDAQVSGKGTKHEIAADFDPDSMMVTFGKILAKVVPGTLMNRAIGEYALHARTVPESVRREVIAARLPVHTWPDRDLRLTAIDARSGKLRVFTADNGVELIDAVAASCAVPGIWPPVSIGDRRYIDGGMRSGSNADLAADCHDVVVISPMVELPMIEASVKAAIDLMRQDSRVLWIQADETATAAMGANPLDPSSAPPSAEAGRAQAAHHVDEVASLLERAS
jgi:NTE family protein